MTDVHHIHIGRNIKFTKQQKLFHRRRQPVESTDGRENVQSQASPHNYPREVAQWPGTGPVLQEPPVCVGMVPVEPVEDVQLKSVTGYGQQADQDAVIWPPDLARIRQPNGCDPIDLGKDIPVAGGTDQNGSVVDGN